MGQLTAFSTRTKPRQATAPFETNEQREQHRYDLWGQELLHFRSPPRIAGENTQDIQNREDVRGVAARVAFVMKASFETIQGQGVYLPKQAPFQARWVNCVQHLYWGRPHLGVSTLVIHVGVVGVGGGVALFLTLPVGHRLPPFE
jgi:hypothetical protein